MNIEPSHHRSLGRWSLTMTRWYGGALAMVPRRDNYDSMTMRRYFIAPSLSHHRVRYHYFIIVLSAFLYMRCLQESSVRQMWIFIGHNNENKSIPDRSLISKKCFKDYLVFLSRYRNEKINLMNAMNHTRKCGEDILYIYIITYGNKGKLDRFLIPEKLIFLTYSCSIKKFVKCFLFRSVSFIVNLKRI